MPWQASHKGLPTRNLSKNVEALFLIYLIILLF